MPRAVVFFRTLANRRRSFLGWAIGLAVLIGVTIAVYPSIRDQGASFEDVIESYPDFVKQILGLAEGLSITSGAGYLNSQFFTNLLPILFLVLVIGFAARETAGEEADGTMDLLLAHPVRRERVIIEKFLAMAVFLFGLAAVAIVTMGTTAAAVSMEVGWLDIIGATLSVTIMALGFGSMALAIGAATGKRSATIAVPAAIAVATFVLWGLVALVSALEPLRVVSPFHWALGGNPILNGIQPGNLALLTGIVIAFAGAAVWGFGRRDIGV